MHRPLAVALVIVALVVPSAAADERQDIAFGVPAQLGGDFNGTALSWLLFLFRDVPRPEAHATVSFPGEVVLTNKSLVQAARTNGYGFNTTGEDYTVPSSQSGLHGLGASLEMVEPGSLFVAGRNVRATLRSTTGVLLEKPAGMCTAALVSHDDYLEHLSWPWADCSKSPQAAFRLDARGSRNEALLDFTVEADGPITVLLRGASITCTRGPACPDGGGSRSATIPLPFGAAVETTEFWFTHLQGNGTLVASGSAAVALGGGDGFDLEGNGWLRLPGAHGVPGRCPASGCFDPANRTLWASGPVALHAIQMLDSGGLGAQVGGSPSLLLDEQAIPSPFLPADVGLGVAAAVGAGLVLWKAFAFLLARRTTDSPRRQAVLQAIQGNPGIHLRELARHLGLATTPLLYHVRRLAADGLVVRRRHGNTIRLFENHGRYGSEWQAYAVLRDPRARRVHAFVGSGEGKTRRDVARAAASFGMSRSGAYHVLARLEKAGLLVTEGGRLQALAPVPRSPGQAQHGPA